MGGAQIGSFLSRWSNRVPVQELPGAAAVQAPYSPGRGRLVAAFEPLRKAFCPKLTEGAKVPPTTPLSRAQ